MLSQSQSLDAATSEFLPTNLSEELGEDSLAITPSSDTCNLTVLGPASLGTSDSYPNSTMTGPTLASSEIPSGDIEDLWDRNNIHLNDLKLTVNFINALRDASLDNSSTGLSREALERLRNPPRERPSLLVDEDMRLAIDLFFGNSSEISYETNRATILC